MHVPTLEDCSFGCMRFKKPLLNSSMICTVSVTVEGGSQLQPFSDGVV
jgi:hypothetical protein